MLLWVFIILSSSCREKTNHGPRDIVFMYLQYDEKLQDSLRGFIMKLKGLCSVVTYFEAMIFKINFKISQLGKHDKDIRFTLLFIRMNQHIESSRLTLWSTVVPNQQLLICHYLIMPNLCKRCLATYRKCLDLWTNYAKWTQVNKISSTSNENVEAVIDNCKTSEAFLTDWI